MSALDFIRELMMDELIASPSPLWSYRLEQNSLSEAMNASAAAGDQFDTASAARRLERVGRRLSAEGFREDALRATTRAVEMVAEPAIGQDRTYDRLRIQCLIALATQLDDLGDPDATSAFQRAISELRRLPAALPSVSDLLHGQAQDAENKPLYPLDLAHALLGMVFSQLSDDPGADVRNQLLDAFEAVRHLGEDSGLANFVRTGLITTSGPIGRVIRAPVFVSSGIDPGARSPIWRREMRERLYDGLARARTENRPHEVIAALRSLAIYFGDVGRFEDAAAALNEAVYLQRPLVNCDSPQTCKDRIAILTEYERRLSEAGASEEVREARREICDLHQSLWIVDPALYTSEFAASLRILREAYESAQNPSFARLTQQRLLVLLQPAISSNPAEELAYARELLRLTDQLRDLSSCDAAGHFEIAALRCLCRILDAFTDGDGVTPAASEEVIAEACLLMSRQWSSVSQPSWSRPSAAKLWLDVALRLAATNPGCFLSQLSSTFGLTCSALVKTGLSGVAISAYSNVLSCVRTRTGDQSSRQQEAFLELLDGYQQALAGLGRDAEAVEIVREALAARHAMAAAGDECEDEVLRALEVLLELLIEQDRCQEASDVRLEIIELLRRRIERSRGVFAQPSDKGQFVAIADLDKLASHLEAAEMLDEAIAVRRTILSTARNAFEANPLGIGFGRGFGPFNSVTRFRLVDSLKNLTTLLARTGAAAELAALLDELERVS